MANVFATEVVRSVRHSLGRFLAIVGIVAIGCGFFAGLRMTGTGMRKSADIYYDGTNLYDLQLVSTLGLSQATVDDVATTPGVTQVMPSRSVDVMASVGENQLACRVTSFDVEAAKGSSTDGIRVASGEDGYLNRLVLRTGHWPEAPDQCVVLEERAEHLGDAKTVHVLYGSSSLDDVLDQRDFEVVGTVSSTFYTSSSSLAPTTLGSGMLQQAIFVPDGAFDPDSPYTECFIKVGAAGDQVTATDGYQEQVDVVEDEIALRLDEIADARLVEVKGDAQSTLDENRVDFERERDDAYRELDDAQRELVDARLELEDGEAQYAEGLASYEDGVRQLQDGEAQYADGLASYEDGQRQLADGEAQYADGLAQYQDGVRELQDGENAYADGLASYEDGQRQLADAEAQYQAGAQQVTDWRLALADATAQLDAAEAELVPRQEEYTQAEALYQDGLAQYEAGVSGVVSQFSGLVPGASTLGEVQSGLDALASQLQAAADAGDPSARAQLEQVWTAQGQFAAASRELDASKAQLDATAAQLGEAKAQLDAAQGQIDSGREEVAARRSELDAAEAQLAESRAQLDAAQAEAAAGKAQLDASRAQLDEGWSASAAGKETLDASRSQLDAAQAEAAAGKAQLDDSRAQLDSGWAESADGKRQLDDSRAQLDDGWAEYNDGLATYVTERADALRKIDDAQAEIDDAQAEIDDLERPDVYVLDRTKNYGAQSYANDSERIDAIGSVFPFFFFVVAALVALTTMTRMVEDERGLIGTYKALGYSTLKISSKYLIYAAIASGVGAVIGILIMSQLLPWVIPEAYSIVYHVPHRPFPLPIEPGPAIAALALGVGCTLAATLSACLSSLRESPASLMQPKAPKVGRRILLERIGPIWRKLSFSWKVTMRNIFRYKRRFTMTVIGIAGCTALLVTGFGVRDAISDIIDIQYGELVHHDVVIGLSEDATTDEVQAVDDYLASTGGAGELVEADTQNLVLRNASGEGDDRNIQLICPEDLAQFEDIRTLRTRIGHDPIPLGEDSVIISEKAANYLGVPNGGEVRLYEPDDAGNVSGEGVPVTVTSVTENYLQSYLYVGHDAYEAIFGEAPRFDTIFTTMDQDPELRSDVSKHLQAMPDVDTVSFEDEMIDTYRTMLNSVDLVMVVLIVSAAALAFVVLYNLANINISERVREIASLKVLGFLRREVDAYVFREILMIVLIGALVGLVLGYFFEAYVIVTAEVDAAMFGREIHWPSYLYAFLLTMAFSVLVLLAMRPKLRHIDMVESLKSVE